ncbi:MAG TPA: RNA-binding cell elongation regulator Jag/EloR [Gaiellaceae bacterium]|nr:RNA-binding cell elongation regulator Jag/EloR [Gaiellaceae bacterium]
MSEELHAEGMGETVGEAKWAALRELERLQPGLDKAAVRFQVVSEGERGLLGVGYEPARVLATVSREDGARPDAATADPEGPVPELAREVLERIVEGIGARCRIDLHEEDDVLVATCTGGNLGLLIGKHGQTIDAIQYLANAIVSRTLPDDRRQVVVDASGYRARRETTLASIARRSAERAVQFGDRVELEPMTAVERKVVHVALKDYPGVETTSEGTEPNRFVVVMRADGGE